MAINSNISDGEVVNLKSKDSNIQVEINIDNNISDYVILMYAGWCKKHSNPNFLTSSDISDMGGQVTIMKPS